MRDENQRVNVLGVGINAVTMEQTLARIDEWITKRDPHYVCLSTVNGVMECQRQPALRHIFNQSGLTTPDGMPLVWLSRLYGYRSVERVYGPDLMLALCQHSVSPGYRHFFFGGTAGVAETLATTLARRFPGIQVAGVYSPPFRDVTSSEDDAIVQQINATQPDILWVGLGTPKQEWWMARHVGRVVAPVLIGVGAAFDFHAGRKKQAPHWMQRNGLEWLFRLVQEPRRLCFRYLVYNPLFLCLVALQLARIKHYRLTLTDSHLVRETYL